jgi:hypothetical protein
MKTPLSLLCSLALLAGQLAAKEPVVFNELKLEDGTILKAATVLRVDPDGLHVSHHEGVSKVKFENLPENVQKQFEFDREEAERFRLEKETAREALEATERKERVDAILAKKQSEQEEDLRRGREEFFALLGTGEYSYPQLEKILMDSIAALKAAGRDDLAAILEDDRKLLREREVTRPAESLRRERDQLAARVRDLENQLVQLNNKPAEPQDTTIWPIFVDRPVFIPRTIVVDHPTHPPAICPPAIAPHSHPRPRLTPFSPGTPVIQPSTPIVPRTPLQDRFRPSTPAAPQIAPRMTPPAPQVTPRSSSGAQVHGAHLWKKQ